MFHAYVSLLEGGSWAFFCGVSYYQLLRASKPTTPLRHFVSGTSQKNMPSEDEKKHETVECRKVIALKYTT